ncbi:hypothetical protein [Cohnella sp. WQ 127256]|uniref:hypothetical protein n=1 Tax=Cohnella sp. WQ 127256 TaxID=2938790 RepID=UPI002117DA05|nr:hypothetical protein [Cohnella sp. WQ 127256]
MSKNKVWNRGKHNGRGLPPRKDKELNPVLQSTVSEQPVVIDSTLNSAPTPANTVKRMNRDNWVQRVTPTKRQDKK